MPIFEFQCTECDEISEEIVSFKRADKLLTIICPFCNGIANKQYSFNSTFMLKGNGWFKDGYDSGTKQIESENSNGEE
jgi:putative FmdB family regulatory protein